MEVNNMERHIKFVCELLILLKAAFQRMEEITVQVCHLSGEFYERAFNESLFEIQTELDKYNANLQRTREINHLITQKINNWYCFIKSPDYHARLTYPIRYLLAKRSLKRDISKLNEEISSIAIENRFIREQLSIWEHKLEVKAIRNIMDGNEYQAYENASKEAEAIIAELRYLLPTIPDMCPAEISSSTLDTLIGKLSSFKAA